MIQMSAAANRATPTNSLKRRETVDPFTRLYLHDDGQHERAAARTLPEKPPQLHADFFLHQTLIRTLLDARLFHDFTEHARAVGEQCLAVLHDEAARDDVGHAFERAGLLVDRDDRHDEAVLGEMTAIPQHLVADLAGARVVD